MECEPQDNYEDINYLLCISFPHHTDGVITLLVMEDAISSRTLLSPRIPGSHVPLQLLPQRQNGVT